MVSLIEYINETISKNIETQLLAKLKNSDMDFDPIVNKFIKGELTNINLRSEDGLIPDSKLELLNKYKGLDTIKPKSSVSIIEQIYDIFSKNKERPALAKLIKQIDGSITYM